MKYNNIYDLHTHSDNSFDGNHSCVLLCESAVDKGAKGIAITDHLDIDDKNMKTRTFVTNQFVHTTRVKSAFKGKLEVLQGIELGQGIYRKELSEKVMKEIVYDFVIGAIHNLENMEDFYFLEYTEESAKELLYRYFSDVYELVKWDKTDSLAHLTYPLRYMVGKYKLNISLEPYKEMIDEILEKLIENKKALEINVSSLDKYHCDFMPSLDTVKRYRELGGKYITVGSDAHYCYDVCKNVEKAYDELLKLGFTHITVFRKREPQLITIE